ncbi:MAG: hypothetical protein ACLFU2_00985 [Opitutales bacterium]
MKTNIKNLLLLTLPLLPLLSFAQSPGEADGFEILEVRVDVPSAWNVFTDERLGSVLLSHIRTVFEREGFEGEIRRVAWGEQPADDLPFLDLKLFEWRINDAGMVECSIRGSFTTADGAKVSLGTIKATEFTWGDEEGWTMDDSFDDAAKKAARDLWRELDEKGLAMNTDFGGV